MGRTGRMPVPHGSQVEPHGLKPILRKFWQIGGFCEKVGKILKKVRHVLLFRYTYR